MKVKCVRVLDFSGHEVASSPWLKLGAVYHVLAISWDAMGTREYSIVSSERIGEWPDFGSHRAECFEIVSTVVPSNWRVWVHQSSAIGISPGAWQEPGFAEALADHDPEIYPIFQRERSVILKEDP